MSVEELMLLNYSVGEDSWESLGLQGDPTIHSEGDQPWDFFGRNDAKAETPVLWPPDAESWLIGKDSDAGRDWGQEEKGMIEDEMAGWHHWLKGRESEWTPGVGDRQGGLTCCNSWGHKESDMTECLNWTELKQHIKKQIYYFANKGPSSQGYCFSSGHVWMWELDYKESWVLKNWCFWTVVLEETLESPLDCNEIQPVHSEGDQPWISSEGMALKLKCQYFGHLMRRVDSLEKTLMLGGIGGRRKRGW